MKKLMFFLVCVMFTALGSVTVSAEQPELTMTTIGYTEDGSLEVEDGVVNFETNGTDFISAQNENFNYAYVQGKGDFELIVKVTGLDTTGGDIPFGLVARNNLRQGSRSVILAYRNRNGGEISFYKRIQAVDVITGPIVVGGEVVFNNTSQIGGAKNLRVHRNCYLPVWLRMSRVNDTVVYSYSFDGIEFYNQSNCYVSNVLLSNVYIGIAGVGNSTDESMTTHLEYVTALFGDDAIEYRKVMAARLNEKENKTTNAIVAPADGGLSSVSIGSDENNVSFTGEGGEFALSGGGNAPADGQNEDKVSLAFKETEGDFEAIVNVRDTDGASGLMVRDNLNPDCVAMSVGVDGDNIVSTYRGYEKSGNVCITKSRENNTNWLKLTRKNNVFTTYCSADGKEWEQLFEKEIVMNSTANTGVFTTGKANLSDIFINDIDVYIAYEGCDVEISDIPLVTEGGSKVTVSAGDASAITSGTDGSIVFKSDKTGVYEYQLTFDNSSIVYNARIVNTGIYTVAPYTYDGCDHYSVNNKLIADRLIGYDGNARIKVTGAGESCRVDFSTDLLENVQDYMEVFANGHYFRIPQTLISSAGSGETLSAVVENGSCYVLADGEVMEGVYGE